MPLLRRSYITSGLWGVVMGLLSTRSQEMQDFANFRIIVWLCGKYFRQIRVTHHSGMYYVICINHNLRYSLILQDGCMAHLDWYKQIKQNIGSVEQSSFKQLEHIRSNGQYSVIAATKRSFSRLQIQDVFLNILPERRICH